MSIELNRDIQFNRIYETLNRRLFGNKLPEHVFLGATYKLRTEGQFLPKKHEIDGQSYHEILIDENLIDGDRDYMIMVFVHQMVHLWQWEYGKQQSSKHYHNKEFIQKLNSLGIEAKTSDGYKLESESINPQSVLGYVIAEEDSTLKVTVVPRNAGAKLDMPVDKGKNKKIYICLTCGEKMYGKPGLLRVCAKCHPEILEQYPALHMIQNEE